jgi:hypothetical protein
VAHEVGGEPVTLAFAEGSPLAGASIRVSLDMSMRRFIALQRAVARATEDGDTWDDLEQAYAIFTEDALLGWDLTFKGEPIPADLDGLMSLPKRTCMPIFNAFISVVMASDPNSSAASESGPTSAADSERTAAA